MGDKDHPDEAEASDDRDGFRATLTTIAHVSQIGFNFVFAVLIAVGIGYWLDKVVGTGRVFKLIFLVLGILAGLYTAYESLSRYLYRTDDNSQN